MEIYPQDLGRAHEREVRRRREYFRRAPLPSPAARRTHWAEASLNPLFAFVPILVFVAIMGAGKPLPWWAYAAILSGVIVLAFLARWLPRWWRRRRQKLAIVPQGEHALTAQEIEWLRADTDDPLHGSFCDLALTTLASPTPPDGLSEAHLRDALRSLGEAARDVPELSFKLTARDAREMVSVARRLTEDAQAETDPVVADSLRRRADALHGQADTVQRAQVLLRRNQTLRLELADQMAALRTELAASAIGQHVGGRGLPELADSISRVAAEARAVTGARAEVDGYLHTETGTVDAPNVQQRLL